MEQSKILLVIGLVYPQPHTTAAGWRMQQLLQLFKEEGWKIHYWHTNSQDTSNELPEIDSSQLIEVNLSEVDNFLKEIKPKIVLFDRFVAEEQFGWRVRENCPNALTILDTEDLHFLREARATAYQKYKSISNVDYHTSTMYREMASIHRCDITILISSFEKDLLINEFSMPESQLMLLPFLWEKTERKTKNRFSERKNMVTIGNLKHEPNRALVKWLYQHWELFRKEIPEVEMHVYGAYADAAMLQLHQPKKGFYLKGTCDHVEETLSHYKIMMAPVPFGAGQKGKILDALQFQIPVVTNSIGMEGMGKPKDWNGLIAENIEKVIELTKLLYFSEEAWKESMVNYPKLLSYFAKDQWVISFWKKLQPILDNVSMHRKKHYRMGMMNHQNMQASRYLSKWIEEKNNKGNVSIS